MFDWIKKNILRQREKRGPGHTFDDADRAMASTMRALNRQIQRRQKMMELKQMQRALDDMEREADDDYEDDDEEEEPQDEFQKFMQMIGATVANGQPQGDNTPSNEGWPVDPRFPPANVVVSPSPPAPTPNPIVINALAARIPPEMQKMMQGMSEAEVIEITRALHKQLKGTKP